MFITSDIAGGWNTERQWQVVQTKEYRKVEVCEGRLRCTNRDRVSEMRQTEEAGRCR